MHSLLVLLVAVHLLSKIAFSLILVGEFLKWVQFVREQWLARGRHRRGRSTRVDNRPVENWLETKRENEDTWLTAMVSPDSCGKIVVDWTSFTVTGSASISFFWSFTCSSPPKNIFLRKTRSIHFVLYFKLTIYRQVEQERVKSVDQYFPLYCLIFLNPFFSISFSSIYGNKKKNILRRPI